MAGSSVLLSPTMAVSKLRRSIHFLVMGAFLLVTTTQLIPLASAAPDCDMTMMSQGAEGSGPVPCTDMTPSCIIDAGCAAMVSLPAPDAEFSVSLSWARIDYDVSSASFRGLSIEPDLTPPIATA